MREAEKLVARISAGLMNGTQATSRRTKPDKSRDVLRLEEEFSDLLTAQVEVRMSKRARAGEHGGEVNIAFGSLDELEGLIAKLRRAR